MGAEHTCSWSNALGEIVPTGDQFYDLNIGSNVSWTPVDREDQ